MVITVMWTSYSWLIASIAVSTLFLSALILICIICFRRNRQNTLSIHTITRPIIKGGISESLSRITKFKRGGEIYDCVKVDSELLDSTEDLNEFDTSSLQLENPQLDDVMSCYSTDSKRTYFSTYPTGLARSISGYSNASTFKSTKNLSRSSSLFSVKIDFVK